MTIDGESYDPFSAETLKVLAPPHRSFREEIIKQSREKYTIPADAAKKLIQEEESTILRSAQEKAIIEGKARGSGGGQEGNGVATGGVDKTPEPLI
jgi:hypothetical protein